MRIFQPHIKEQETTVVKPGTLLISQAFWNKEEFQRSAVLVLEHNERGSTGIILNKLTSLTVNQVLPGLNINTSLSYGGPIDLDRIGFIHHSNQIINSVKITDNIYWGGNFYQLKTLLKSGELRVSKVKFFAGLMEWTSGELDYEIKNKYWWTNEISFHEIIKKDSIHLWSSKLIGRENLYGMLHEIPDPFLS